MITDRGIALIDDSDSARQFMTDCAHDPFWRCVRWKRSLSPPEASLAQADGSIVAVLPAGAYFAPCFDRLEQLLPPIRIVYGTLDQIRPVLMFGVTDFVVAPWESAELRVRTILHTPAARLRAAGITLHGHALAYRSTTIHLRHGEMRILSYLLRLYGEVATRDLLAEASTVASRRNTRSVDMTVSRLRRKLSLLAGPHAPLRIETVRGIGYRLSIEEVDNRWKTYHTANT